MKFTANKKALFREVDLLQGIANRKSAITILNHILLDAREDKLVLTASDSRSSITTTCPYSSLTNIPGKIAVLAKRFRDILNEFDNIDIDFELQDNNRLKMTHGRTTFNVVCQDAVHFPEPEKIEEYSASVPLTILAGQIERVVFAIPLKEEGNVPKGAQLNIEKNVISMAAANQFQFPVVKSNIIYPDSLSALIPEDSIKELMKLLNANSDKEKDGVVFISKTENRIFFKVGDREMSSSLIATPFPNIKNVPQGGNNFVTLNRDLFSRILRRIVVMSDEKLPFIQLKIDNGIMEVSAESRDAGDGKDFMDVESNGLSVKLNFNANVLLSCLTTAKTEKIQMQIKDSTMPVILRPLDDIGFDWMCITMVRRDISEQ